MYKSRIGIWSAVLAIILVITGCYKFIVWMSKDPVEYNMYCMTSDNVLKTNISNIGGDIQFNIYDTKEGADFIIQPTSDEVIAGYTKYSNYIYSPLVMFARKSCLDPEYGFSVLDASSSYVSTAYKDLAIILEAMEQDKSFTDIGINKKVAEGNVSLYIPSQTSIYYPLVEDLFYITLNGGYNPSAEQKELLKERVDSLLSKCQKIEDVGATITALYKKNDKAYTLFIGPECAIVRDTYAFNTTNENAWMTVYLNHTCTDNYDLYIKTDKKDELFEGLINSSFSKETGYRIYNTSNFSDSYSHTIDSITLAK